MPIVRMAEIGKLLLLFNHCAYSQHKPTAIAECCNDDAYDVEKMLS